MKALVLGIILLSPVQKNLLGQVSPDSSVNESEPSKKRTDAKVSIGFDQFWGSWVSANISTKLDSTGWIKSVEFYLQGWQNPALGNGLGSDPWVEVGASALWKPLGEVWKIKTLLGVTSGRFLVASSFGNVAESVALSLQNEVSLFGIYIFLRPKYYFVLFNRGRPANDLFILSGGGGYDFSPAFSSELRGEWVGASRSTSGNEITYYRRLGIALRYNDRKFFSMEADFGLDFSENFSNGNYYRWLISLGF
jgi:hypothetical protein